MLYSIADSLLSAFKKVQSRFIPLPFEWDIKKGNQARGGTEISIKDTRIYEGDSTVVKIWYPRELTDESAKNIAKHLALILDHDLPKRKPGEVFPRYSQVQHGASEKERSYRGYREDSHPFDLVFFDSSLNPYALKQSEDITKVFLKLLPRDAIQHHEPQKASSDASPKL